MLPARFTIYDMIERNAICYGGRIAWIDGGNQTERRFTFAHVFEEVRYLAGGLRRLGITKGDRIGVVAGNSHKYFCLYGAAAALGAIILPINWRLSAEEILFNLQDGKPKIVFADPEYFEVLNGIRPHLSCVSFWISFEQEQDNQFQPYESAKSEMADFHPTDISADDDFVIIHTAAVAGRPRGAVLSHNNVLWANLQFMALMNIVHRDVHLSLLPFFHVAGLFMVMACFHAGAKNINMEKFDANLAVDLIERHHVSVLFDFTPILNSILDSQSRSGTSIQTLRAVTGLDTPETIEKFQNLTEGKFYSLYGQTETSCITTLSPYEEQPGSAGRPVPMAAIGLLDDTGHCVPQGQTGEIAVRGPMVFKGYWNLPEENARTFRNGWHHTGDLGRFDGQGYLWYEGRKADKELIKPGGENVYPAEVEKVILEHPAVAQTVVFGVPDPKWKEGIKAVCVLKPSAQINAQALIRFVGDRIARYKKPQYVEFATELPTDKNGNIDRAAVKTKFGVD